MGVKVSFIVAVYNVEQYIGQCVRSLYEQTLEDIEIVLVDDCSTDDSTKIALEILEEYPARHQQVRVVRHKKNTGIKDVRKDGLWCAEGDYIINVDGDDYVEPQMAERMYYKAVEMDADMVICGFWWYREHGRLYRMPLPTNVLGDTDSIKDATLDRYGWPNIWCRMIKRELLMRDDMLWPAADHPDDLVIAMAATYYARRIVSVSAPLYHYRYNHNSTTRNSSPSHVLKKYHDFVLNNSILIDFYQKKGISSRYQRGIIVNKMSAKNELLPLTSKSQYRRLWRRTYSELNKVMFFGNKAYVSTYREKMWLLAVSSGLYPRFKRLLLNKRLRPASVWMSGGVAKVR